MEPRSYTFASMQLCLFHNLFLMLYEVLYCLVTLTVAMQQPVKRHLRHHPQMGAATCEGYLENNQVDYQLDQAHIDSLCHNGVDG